MTFSPASVIARAIICSALLAVGGSQHEAAAQSNTAKNAAGAAGVIILQQHKMRQELNETKKELKAIREDLGIEEPARSNSNTSSFDSNERKFIAIMVCIPFVLFFCFCGWVVCWYFLTKSVSRSEKLGTAFVLLKLLVKLLATVVKWGLIALIFTCPSYFFPPGDQHWEVATFCSFCAAAAFWIICGRLFPDKLQGNTDTVTSSPTECEVLRAWQDKRPVTSFPTDCAAPWLRFSGGEIRGPCHKRDVLAAAAAGVYSANTEWGVSKEGPWKPLVTANVYWLKTSKGRAYGPYKREQISKALKNGKIPPGSEMSLTANGPWVKIDSAQF